MELKNYIVSVRLKPRGPLHKVKIQATGPVYAKQIAEGQYYEVVGTAHLDHDAEEAKRRSEQVRREAEQAVRRSEQEYRNTSAAAPPVTEIRDQDAGSSGLLGSIGAVLGALSGKANRKQMSPAEIAMRSAVQEAARSSGSRVARQILRGVLGGMSKK